MLIGTVLGCVAGLPGVNGYALFITSRLVIGFGLASYLMTSMVTIQEITHPRTRATMAASWVSRTCPPCLLAPLLHADAPFPLAGLVLDPRLGHRLVDRVRDELHSELVGLGAFACLPLSAKLDADGLPSPKLPLPQRIPYLVQVPMAFYVRPLTSRLPCRSSLRAC